jgi:hypothetical protein
VIARTLALLVGLIVATSAGAQTPPAPLVLEAKIPLGSISGRIDHLAIDLKRKWLFVAELGNDSLGVVNVVAGKVLRTITGLSEPQGVGTNRSPTPCMWPMRATAQSASSVEKIWRRWVGSTSAMMPTMCVSMPIVSACSSVMAQARWR